LIDVEPKIAYAREHLDGAVNLPLEEIEVRHKELPKDKLIITYCHCGGESSRAKQAADKLAGLNFKKVAYLGEPASAFFEYKKAGHPVAVNLNRYIAIEQLTTAAGSPVFISTASAPHILKPVSPRINPAIVSCEILYFRMKNHPEEVGKNFIVIDLREKEEYDAGHIPRAQNIPLGKLLSKNSDGRFVYETLPKDKEIFVYCAGGYRSKIAAQELLEAGYDKVYSLDGGFTLWRKNNYEIEK
jgi:rhodanese-related sulfurtransferase